MSARSADELALRGGVLVVGEAIIDIISSPGVPPQEHVGGSPANVALGLGRLGVPVRLHTALARDSRGARIAAHLEGEGVRIDPASWHLLTTPTAHARIVADGSATYEFDLVWDLAESPRPERERLLHVGSLGAFLRPGADIVEGFVHRLPAELLVTFDPNIRAALIGDRAEAVRRAEAIAARAAIVKFSDEDADWLYPDLAIPDVIDRLLGIGVSVVAITLGEAGAVLASPRARVRVSAPQVEVVDTVGAGDTFMAALIDRALDAPSALHGADELNLVALANHAVAAASVTVSRAGADLPSRPDIAQAKHTIRQVRSGPRTGPNATTERMAT